MMLRRGFRYDNKDMGKSAFYKYDLPEMFTSLFVQRYFAMLQRANV